MNHDTVESIRTHLNKISDHYGLISPGLTCYLNSVLQVLFMTEDFRDKIKSSQDITAIDKQLKALFTNLETNKARTHEITQRLGIKNVYKQRDAAEYFEKLLRLTSPEASKMFKGKMNHVTICCRCKDRNEGPSFFWILPLSVKDPYQTYSVEDGLDAFFREEKLSGENRFYCTQCRKKQDAVIKYEMTQPPEVLTLLLKRFHYDDELMSYVKLDCKAEVPITLHDIPYMKNCTYQLYAMVNHYGTLTGGHYVARIHSFQTGEWYSFNDDTVRRERHYFESGKTSVRSRTSYLLMYKKKHISKKEQDSTISDAEAEETQEDSVLSENMTNQMNGFSASHQTDVEIGRHRLASPKSQRKLNCSVNSNPHMSHMGFNSTGHYQEGFTNKQLSPEKNLESKCEFTAEDINPTSGFRSDLHTTNQKKTKQHDAGNGETLTVAPKSTKGKSHAKPWKY